jgi:hypothetical protein
MPSAKHGMHKTPTYKIQGVTATLAEIVERFVTPPYQAIYARLRSGWSVEDALTIVDGRKNKCHS